MYREFSATSYICAYTHHENVDGTGYPRKIKGDQIYDYANYGKVLAVYKDIMTRD